MRAWKILPGITLIVLLTGAAWAAYVPLRTDVAGDKPEAVVLKQNATEVQLEIRVPGIDLKDGVLDGKRWDRVAIPGGGTELDLGAPETPHFTRLLVIPATAAVHADFEAVESTTIPNILLMPAQGDEPEDLQENHQPVKFDMSRYSRNELYPAQRVMVGDPAVMRGMRVVTLRTNPVQYNPVTHELVVTTMYRVTVHFSGQDVRSVPTRPVTLSKAWGNMVKGVSFNMTDDVVDAQNMGSYLIICVHDDGLNTDLQPLIDWKNREGHSVTLQTFAAGASNTTIKAMIQTAYDTWPTPPEYVLLVGEPTGTYALPAWYYGGGTIDHPYSQLDGPDILADVAVGRMPTNSQLQTQIMVNKVLYYEKMPYTTNPSWFSQAGLVAWWSTSLSMIQTNRWIKTLLEQANYTRIDTLWYTMGGDVPSFMSNTINNGVTYINYRGWIGMQGFGNDQINALNNGRLLCFATILTCSTGGFNGPTYPSNMETFALAGTSPTSPKGAVACTGLATSSTHVHFNNTIDMGIYAGLFEEGITQTGTSVNRGKLELYNAYHLTEPDQTNNFSNWCALAGDPGVELYTGAIQYMTCQVPDQVTYGVNSLTLSVHLASGRPVPDATVCLYKPNESQSVGITDTNGQVTLPLRITSPGNVKVTITCHNYYPIVDSLDVVSAAVAVGYQNHTVDDDNIGGTVGDNDQVVNPGETVDLHLIFKNYGTSTTATGISTTASESDTFATLSNATQTFPDLAPGASGNSSGAVRVVVAPNCPNHHIVQVALNTTSNQGTWTGGLTLNIASFFAKITSVAAQGSDTLLSPGETANLLMTIKNLGSKAAGNLTAKLRSLDPLVTINDSVATFGTVAIGATATCNSDPFNLTASSLASPGHYAHLKITFSGNLATQADTTITIMLGSRTQSDPQGPDAYGYYCYDNTDINYTQMPTYDWVEIDPGYGGSGTQLPLVDMAEDQDQSVNVNLPFAFRYYGTTTNQVTVCDNGWISSVPNIAFNDFRNYEIPSPIGPSGKICPFWDDLITSPGHVFAWSDATHHRFIVEWSRMCPMGMTSPQEIFEAILYDPAFNPTPTGDGEIVFQYNSITEVYGTNTYDNRYSTIGIESPNHQTGIQVAYWNTYYDPAAAHVQNGRAYKFTTAFNYQSTAVHTTLTPHNPPITIPATGGSFQFDAQVANTSVAPASFSAWIMQHTPNGHWQGPLMGPFSLTVPGGITVSRTRTQNIPGFAPPGVYIYRGYIGIYSAGIKWDSSSFIYTKLANGDGPLVDNWDNWGESFAPYLSGEHSAEIVAPSTCNLEQNYPNPFNPSTNISYQLAAYSHISLRVYDLAGRVVTTLVEGWQEAGSHQATFDGSKLASGLYFVKMQATQGPFGAGEFSQVRKMMLVK